VSKGVRFVEQLTSPEFVRATRSEAMLLGVSFTILGAGAAWLLALPWYAPMVIGFAGFAVSTGVLIVHNRTLLHATVNQQGKAGEKRRAELRVQVDGVGEGGNHSNSHAEFLYLKCAVNAAQLTEWARAALDGGGLGVHKWTGQGALFTRSQYDNLCSELLTMGYLVDRGGNLGRQLTAKGRALCRALAER
jgi:hypothetical protein